MIRPTPGPDPASRQTLPPGEVAALAHHYGRGVFLAAFRVLGDPAQAEDVQQDVFLRLLQRRFPAVESWPAMLQSMAVRLAIDRLRRRGHRGRPAASGGQPVAPRTAHPRPPQSSSGCAISGPSA